MRAAQALKAAIKQNDSKAVVQIVDGIEYVSHIFNKIVVDGYKFSAMKMPKAYGLAYRAADTDTPVYKVMQKSVIFFAKKMVPLLNEFKPDAVVTTHPFTAMMFARLRQKGVTNIPLISIVTDFAPHNAYINEDVSAYIVSSEEMVDSLEEIGIDRSIIHPVGIPIDPIFYKKDDNKAELLTEMGFDPNLKTVLIMAGSFGVTDILKIYENINEIDLDFQIVVITGKNKKLFNAFNTILDANPDILVGKAQLNFDDDRMKWRYARIEATKPTKLVYFTDEVYKYMHAADLIITKPGGLTVSESLASCLPLAIFKAIPGQETDNSEYLINNNLAVAIKKSNAAEIIYRLLKYPERLLSMRESCDRLNNKDAALKVYDIIKTEVASMTEAATVYNNNEWYNTLDLTDDIDYDEISRIFKKYKDDLVSIGVDDSYFESDDFDSDDFPKAVDAKTK